MRSRLLKLLDKAEQRLKQDEKGIALLFTLGILSLLLVLALAFATNAITERKAAANNNNLSIARLMSFSAMQRSLAAMKFYSSVSNNFDAVLSHQAATGKNDLTNDFVCHLHTVLDDKTYIDSSSDLHLTSPSDLEAVHWQYLHENANTDSPIIGRICYYVVSNKGKLDPSACVDSGAVSSPALNENGANEKRYGANVSEINLQNLDPGAGVPGSPGSGAYMTTDDVKFVSASNASPAGTLPAGTRWVDMETLVSSLETAESSSFSSAKKGKFSEWMQVGSVAFPEAFWVDSDNNQIKEDHELYHRFNLARTDWNDVTVDSIINTTIEPYSGSYSGEAGIPWIANWKFPNNNIVKSQIAANLIDYCDYDGAVSATDATAQNPSDAGYTFAVTSDSADWTASDPTYAGNERTPYLNEIGVFFEASCAVTGGPPPANYTKTYTINMKVFAEAIKIYSGNFTRPTYFKILDGSVSFEYVDADGNTQTHTVNLATDSNYSVDDDGDTATDALLKINEGVWDDASGDGYRIKYEDLNAVTLASTGLNSSKSITNVKVRIDKAILIYNGINADIALVDKNRPGAPTTIAAPVLPCNYWFTYQTEDPRINLYYDKWFSDKESLAAADYGTPGHIGTPDSKNRKNDNSGLVDPSAVPQTFTSTSGDLELASDPAYTGSALNQHLSTAYVRNGPMQSPWELGLIHRSFYNWQTLNLRRYPIIAAYSSYRYPMMGGYQYQYGDAPILDQIKMTEDTETYGKVNVNTDIGSVLRALFMNIYVHGNYADPGDQSGGSVITKTIAENYASYLYGITSANQAQTRAEILKSNADTTFSDGSLGLTQTTDALREEMIGKFINLTEASRSDDYVIVAIAQVIKDVGSQVSASSDIVIRKDLNADGNITASVAEPTNIDIDGDGITGEVAGNVSDPDLDSDSNIETIGTRIGRYDQYADEIVAEQKIIAFVRKDSVTGKWKILRYEYLED